MTNEELIEDLKQFIAAAVSQATADVATKTDLADLATREDTDRLNAKIDDVAATLTDRISGVELRLTKRLDDIDLKLETVADAHAEQLSDHDVRIVRLEQRHA